MDAHATLNIRQISTPIRTQIRTSIRKQIRMQFIKHAGSINHASGNT